MFKAKLIGILEVGEARGDRMCQEALQDLKIAIRAAGEHKQRITIHVTIEGLRLRDEKSGVSIDCCCYIFFSSQFKLNSINDLFVGIFISSPSSQNIVYSTRYDRLASFWIHFRIPRLWPSLFRYQN